MLRDFAILRCSSSFVQNHLPAVFHIHASVCFSLLCIRDSLSLPQSVLCDVLLLNTLRVHALETLVPTARISGDCNQT